MLFLRIRFASVPCMQLLAAFCCESKFHLFVSGTDEVVW